MIQYDAVFHLLYGSVAACQKEQAYISSSRFVLLRVEVKPYRKSHLETSPPIEKEAGSWMILK